MTANVDIKRGDLHLAVSTALNRGRYVLMTDGDGQPLEITLDLKERDDDLFGTEQRPFSSVEEMWAAGVPVERMVSTFDWAGNSSPGRLNAAQPSDDHGPTIPAQDRSLGELLREAIEMGSEKDAGGVEWITREHGPSVYEFALQDIRTGPLHTDLSLVGIDEAPHPDIAEASDWVHVYDRVTRERRTLKRPEPDRILTGLRDVAADLRGKRHVWAVGDFARCIIAGPGQEVGKLYTVTDVDQAGGFLGFTGDGAVWMMSRFAPHVGPSPVWDGSPARGAPVDPPFGCAALPPVGPLTSTEGLRAGDVLRCIKWNGDLFTTGKVYEVVRLDDACPVAMSDEGEPHTIALWEQFAFVGRPDADGWITWAGGENPVPGATVHVIFRDGQHLTAESEILELFWAITTPNEAIDRFRIVDTPPAV